MHPSSPVIYRPPGPSSDAPVRACLCPTPIYPHASTSVPSQVPTLDRRVALLAAVFGLSLSFSSAYCVLAVLLARRTTTEHLLPGKRGMRMRESSASCGIWRAPTPSAPAAAAVVLVFLLLIVSSSSSHVTDDGVRTTTPRELMLDYI